MGKRESTVVSILAGSIVLMLAPSVWAVPVGFFTDTDSFIERAKDIVIVEIIGDVNSDADPQSPGDDPSRVDVNILMSLKGNKAKGRMTLATIQSTEKGKLYLVRDPDGGLTELGLVPLSDRLKLSSLAGKTLKQQVLLIFEQRLMDVKIAQKRLAEERLLLEDAVATGPRRVRSDVQQLINFATEVAR